MIDFHTHILPAFDDGAINVDESIAVAKALADFGYKIVHCTPHCIKGYYDLTPRKVREATLMLQADLDNADIRLELRPGMEYMLDEYFAEYADDLLPLGDTRLVLCEAPPQAHPQLVSEGLELVVAKGFVPLIAHPERTEHFYQMITRRAARGAPCEETQPTHSIRGEDSETAQARPGFMKRLFAPRATRHAPQSFSPPTKPSLPETCLFHANLGSFTGYYGEAVQRKAYELLKMGVYTALASDLHDGSSAAKVLVRDKFETNPLLRKLAEFDGLTVVGQAGSIRGGQGELF